MFHWKPSKYALSAENNMGGGILFISDLHLDQNQTEISQHFEHFIKARATDARALYILGDLFEIWLGDDDKAEHFQPLFDALNALSQHCRIFFLPGNRDFLVGQALADRIGMTLIEDEHIIELGQQRVALMHGDSLCVDDVEYQKFRQQVRHADWRQQFLARPLAERKAIADDLRRQSQAATRQKEYEIIDVNALAVEQCFARLAVDTLIHGHTHRPAIHSLAGQHQRIVLGDWRPEASYLSWKDGQFSLVDARVQP